MKQFIKFTFQDYMDLEKQEQITAMDPEKAQDYINFMNTTWSSGHYDQDFHVMEADEALKHVMVAIEREKKAQLPDSEEFIDHLLAQLKECYGIDYKPNN